MTRRLRAAKEGVAAMTKLTEHPPILPNTKVLSVKSVLSIGGEINTEIVDAWEERAAIREFYGGQSRKDAECNAAKDIGLQQADLELIQKRDKWGVNYIGIVFIFILHIVTRPMWRRERDRGRTFSAAETGRVLAWPVSTAGHIGVL
jgi:hypothetical protein